MPSATALQELQRGRARRAWRRVLVAMRRAEQPASDLYVGAFCLFLFGLIVGYGLATAHHERAAAAANATHPHFTTTKGTP